jgi:hypothetical protein
MKWFLALLFAASLSAADGPRLFYSKSFPKSVPAYCQITLNRDGTGEYAEAPDDNNPVTFHISNTEASEVFSLVEKLDNFKRPVESQAKVAFMGAKTFRLENGGEKTEIKFNYSDDPSARGLADWFDKIAESERDRIELERTAKYDKLGVVNALMQIETGIGRNRLVGLDQYLPMLDRIINNESYMHTARERAAGIAAGIRNNTKQ